MASYSREALGQVVRELRDGLSLTQESLGERAGYGRGAGVSVSRLENGLLRPGPQRFAGLAAVLGLTPEELEDRASKQTADEPEGESANTREPADGVPADVTHQRGTKGLKARAMKIQREIDARTDAITTLSETFNEQHDRARSEFVVRFVDVAARIEGAPQPDSTRVESMQWGDEDAGDVQGVGANQVDFSLGRASKVRAGGVAILAGIIASPMLIVAAGGLFWMVKRNRRQQQELADKLDEAEAELAATKPGVEALQEVLPRAAVTLDYIATHAGHAVVRWSTQLGPGTLTWDSLTPIDHQRYQDFADVADAQLTIEAIDAQEVLTARGTDQLLLVRSIDKILTQAQEAVRARV